MSKELFVSSSPHETKVAVFEEDNLVEVFYQRDTDVGLVGGIYKGRVSRVLPGMQSAFVDVGLERDAFLYVSDFFEDSDEYDRVVAEAETRVTKYAAEESGPSARPEPAPAVVSESVPAPPVAPPAERLEIPAQTVIERAATPQRSSAVNGGPEDSAVQPVLAAGGIANEQSSRWQESRGRGRRRRRGRGLGKTSESREHQPPEAAAPAGNLGFLPGESLAKYAHLGTESGIARDGEGNLEAAGSESTEAEKVLESRSDRPARIEGEFGEGTAQRESPSWAPGSPEPSPEASDDRAEGVENDQQYEARAAQGTRAVEEVPMSAREEDAPPVKGPPEGEVPMSAREETQGDTATAEPEPPHAPWPDDGVTGGEDGGAAPSLATGEPSLETGDRSYTLRDSQQRPRFASRRGRRGRRRFARQGPRQEGPPAPAERERPGAPTRRQDQPRGGNEQAVQINQVLKEGQEILVQIAKEPLGSKGARITSHVALPGRYLVYMPTIQHTGVSRKIASEEERLRLRNIVLEHRGSLTGGIIVRTAAAGRSEEELKADVGFLAKLWDEIRSRSERSKAPALIHRDLTLVERILRDILSPDFKSVRVDNELEYQNVLDFVHRFQPSLVGHVKLYTKETPMFEEFGIQAEIDKALKPKVWLKSGGYIVINQTEALVAIDVNTGKYVGKTNRLEDTIVKTNVDAVKEIVRQVRLRDLGGIIVIDFIDMDDRRNRLKVVQALEEALRTDRAPTKIVSFNEFGLVALTRKRVKQSLERTLSEHCPYCAGSGWIKSVTTVCYEILEEAKKMAQEMEGKVLTLRVHPEVARALKSHEGALASELESLTGKDVVIKGDPAVHHERFEIF